MALGGLGFGAHKIVQSEEQKILQTTLQSAQVRLGLAMAHQGKNFYLLALRIYIDLINEHNLKAPDQLIAMLHKLKDSESQYLYEVSGYCTTLNTSGQTSASPAIYFIIGYMNNHIYPEGRKDLAKFYFEIAEKENLAVAAYHLGKWYEESGEMDMAKKYYEKAETEGWAAADDPPEKDVLANVGLEALIRAFEGDQDDEPDYK